MKYIIQDNKIKRINISGLIIKGFIDKNSINKERRIFSGWGSVSIVDKQGDLIPIKEFRPVMEKLMARNAPVTDSHSNHVIGRIIDYEFKPTEEGHDGLYLTAEIFNHYPTDEQAWEKIKSGEFSGFSLGGKAGTKTPQCTNIGCYNVLGDIEAWEFSVVSVPANSKANIDKVNKLAKSDTQKSYIIKNGYIIQKPFAGYKDFEQCVNENKDKGNPQAYCGAIKHKVEDRLEGIMKGKVYVDNPQDAPKDKKVSEGERGGLYYESEGINLQEPKIKPQEERYWESGEIKPGQPFIPRREYIKELNEVPNGASVKRDSDGLLYYELDFEWEGKIYTWNKIKPSESTSKPTQKPPTQTLTPSEKNEIDKIYEGSDGISNIMEAWYEGADGQLSLDQTITKVFKLDPADSRIEGNPAIIGELTDEELNEFKKIYTITQTYLRKKYPNGKIILYRGVDGHTFSAFKNRRNGSNITLQTYNISSWSEGIHVAERFAEEQGKGVIIKIEVPIERIFSYYKIDSFAAEEGEATLIGPSVKGKLLKKINNIEDDNEEYYNEESE